MLTSMLQEFKNTPQKILMAVSYTHLVIVDMSHDCKREVILKGGRGGKGNMNYATPTMQVPKYAPVSYTHLDVYKRQW